MSNDAFIPMNRDIYRYHNGERVVAADPLVLRGKLATEALETGKTLSTLIDMANAVDAKDATELQLAQSWEALGLLSDISTHAFDLVPFDAESGLGAGMAHALGLLHNFHEWLEKKNPTPVLHSTSTPPVESTSETPQTTATSSV